MPRSTSAKRERDEIAQKATTVNADWFLASLFFFLCIDLQNRERRSNQKHKKSKQQLSLTASDFIILFRFASISPMIETY